LTLRLVLLNVGLLLAIPSTEGRSVLFDPTFGSFKREGCY
jgi:hypothetical protein